MAEVVVEIPKVLEGDKARIEHKIQHLVEQEAKQEMLIKLVDEFMKGAKQLSDDELVEFGRELKKHRHVELKKKGLV